VRAVALLLLAGLFAPAPAQNPQSNPPRPFPEWLAELVAEARNRGFSDSLIEQTLNGLEPLPRVITSDRTQAELTISFDRYFNSRVTPAVISRGREIARANARLLADIEEAYGVPRRYLLAIWGMESRYGRTIGNTPVFRALATLAWEPRRSALFRQQLFDALTMVSRGYIDAATMTGSWAGAMGQPQFMPSSYLRYAVDFDNDQRRDIWKSTADVLASIANYLKEHDWTTGQTWGREVRLAPEVRERIEQTIPRRTEGCSAVRGLTEPRPLVEWQMLGVRMLNGTSLRAADIEGALLHVEARSFLVYGNYESLLQYNCAHHYALSVAMLAERLP
jgi:membrane-bound lytic murein transglycosylase B